MNEPSIFKRTLEQEREQGRELEQEREQELELERELERVKRYAGEYRTATGTCKDCLEDGRGTHTEQSEFYGEKLDKAIADLGGIYGFTDLYVDKVLAALGDE